jgi:hypothetical protein
VAARAERERALGLGERGGGLASGGRAGPERTGGASGDSGELGGSAAARWVEPAVPEAGPGGVGEPAGHRDLDARPANDGAEEGGEAGAQEKRMPVRRLWQWVANVGYTKLAAVHKHVRKFPQRYQIDVRATPLPHIPPQRFLSKSYSIEATRERQRVFGRMLKMISDTRSGSERNLAQRLPDELRSILLDAVTGGKRRTLDERESYK